MRPDKVTVGQTVQVQGDHPLHAMIGRVVGYDEYRKEATVEFRVPIAVRELKAIGL